MATATLEVPRAATTNQKNQLTIFGGEKAAPSEIKDALAWPIITREDEESALDVLRRGAMSATDVTKKFEEEYAAWQGNEYALAFCNGTAALQAAMFAVGVGRGDEVICPSITYWASSLQAFSLGATIVFADIDADTLCINPKDIEHRITPKTKAIIAVHYMAHPCAMDEIMAIARKHNVKVIEDVSHAQGGLYKNKKLGTWGDVSGISLMTGKSLAAGEGGMLTTDDRAIYERAIAWGHYDRFKEPNIQSENLKPFCGLPYGAIKGRMHQVSSAVGRVQLKYYDERCVEIRKAMNHFWDLLEGVPGLRAHRVKESEGSNMAGWYAAHGLYRAEELGGLSLSRFAQAVQAEGGRCIPGCNFPMHSHPLLNDCDIYNDGQPTRIAFSDRDLRQSDNDLPISSRINNETYQIPWFKKFQAELIEEQAAAYRKVAENYESLLEDDEGDAQLKGQPGLTSFMGN